MLNMVFDAYICCSIKQTTVNHDYWSTQRDQEQ